jgi:hypothetical protein
MSDDKGTESIPEPTKTDDGGHAFPCQADDEYHHATGMTLRDYFAAKAIGPCIEMCEKDHNDDVEKHGKDDAENGPFDTNSHEFHDNVAFNAYAFADAMIAARAQTSSRD